MLKFFQFCFQLKHPVKKYNALTFLITPSSSLIMIYWAETIYKLTYRSLISSSSIFDRGALENRSGWNLQVKVINSQMIIRIKRKNNVQNEFEDIAAIEV